MGKAKGGGRGGGGALKKNGIKQQNRDTRCAEQPYETVAEILITEWIIHEEVKGEVQFTIMSV